jgi:uncharacterized membrane protein
MGIVPDALSEPQPSRPSAAQTGLLIASALVSETFVPSLAPRSSIDQGIVTGLSVGSHYLLAVGAQDALSGVAQRLIDSPLLRRATWLGEHRQGFLEVATDLMAIPLGGTVGLLLRPHYDESPLRSIGRFVGFRLALAGAAGTSLALGHSGLTALDRLCGAHGALARFPLSIPLGATVAYALERHRSHQALPTPDLLSVSSNSRVASVAVAGGIIMTLSSFAAAEGTVTRHLGDLLQSRLPGTRRFWRSSARLLSFVVLTGSIGVVWDRAMQRIEAATLTDDALFSGVEPINLIGPTVSGSRRSLVPWGTLGREGLRHVLSQVPTAPPAALAESSPLPDFSIETVTGKPALANPVQVYIGLDSATTARERVDLALEEMTRLGAFDRSLLVLISPTGTGYVNYVALAAMQYLSRGDVATVTMQYSKRPSPLAMSQVAVAREQNRLLWMEILIRLRDLPVDKRPRVAVFGESLGAHTSQDVFLNWGTLGPAALGIDRALWFGTPYTSGWMHEVTQEGRLDVDPDAVAVLNDFAELEELGPERRRKLRYVLVNHDNDGVTKLGLDLILTRPDWLSAGARQPRPMPEHPTVPISPRGTPPWMQWRPITTFFHTLIDMKNAQQPGPYRAWAHGYRPDQLRFISEVFGLAAPPELLTKLDGVLRAREEFREALIHDAEQRRREAEGAE